MCWLQQAFLISTFLAGSLQAGGITLTATDNSDGTLTIGIDSFTGDPPVGIALMLDPNSSELQLLNRGMPYYDIITTFDASSNRITAFAALATLGETDLFPPQVPNLMTLDFGGPATGILTEDTLRGGIIDTQGRAMGSNLPLVFTVTGNSCTCRGDVSGPEGVPDNQISTSDLAVLLALISDQPSLSLSPVPDGSKCLDVSGPQGLTDGTLSSSDMTMLVNHISTFPGFIGPCLP